MSDDTPEAILDSVRGLLGWYASSQYPLWEELRLHLSRSEEEVVIPEYVQDLPDQAYINKSIFADILYRTFKRAEAREAEDCEQRTRFNEDGQLGGCPDEFTWRGVEE